MTTTQKTYLHIIQELENKDVDLVMRSLSGLSQNTIFFDLQIDKKERITCVDEG